ncbi:MAG: carbamoyltransferase C-terminal domain-containing protein [Candidatus Hatepunaea meridiana]|nr:carbamoyltransferase C-terminal domain-containing protein [Candidatus Hatepunaea meridiana]
MLPLYVGIFEGHSDPAVAIVRDGEILAYAEEERFVRLKHAPNIYPISSLLYCLNQDGVNAEDVRAIGINWNVTAYTDGTMKKFFENIKEQWSIDENTKRWQQYMLGYFNMNKVEQRHAYHWKRAFGNIKIPPIHPMPHHYVHALHAYFQSSFDKALCITIDGSGDQHCTVLWDCQNDNIQPIKEISMPHSLGWFYAAFTEYLGFQAYNDEYKVMGLAAYGQPNEELREKVRKVILLAENGIEYRLEPKYIFFGNHTWSERFTDDLVHLFNSPMRLTQEPITDWHKDLAYAVQSELEDTVYRLAMWGMDELNVHNICIGGGVGLNVKMNGHILTHDIVSNLFAQPLCSDGGAAAGAALGTCWQISGIRPKPLKTLALGYEEKDDDIKQILNLCRIPYKEVDNIVEIAADELAKGRIISWFQGRMEAGPRALGQRSILGDPRNIEMQDKINNNIKFREYWRPFCPAITAEDAGKYLKRHIDSAFMNVAFEATDVLKKRAPAIVHVDGTVRAQIVHRNILPLFHSLLQAFKIRTGIPILLNTSFNVKGEPIVCTFQDALRTFFSTGLEVLVADRFIIYK